MSLETGFWRIHDDKPQRIAPTAIDYESRLEAILESDVSIVSEPRRWMVIGRQWDYTINRLKTLWGIDDE